MPNLFLNVKAKMRGQLTAAGRLKQEFGMIATELVVANTHFYIGSRLQEAWKGEFQNEFYQALDFWGFTIQAHIRIALVCLCRVFDHQKDDSRGRNLHLLRLIENIDDNQLDPEQRRQRELDLAFLQREEPDQKKLPDRKVLKLRAWRKKLIAHQDYDIVMNGAKAFLKQHPVDFEELQSLIDEGFSILERWAAYHHVHREPCRLVRDKDDYFFVLEAIRLKLHQQRRTARAGKSA